MTTTTLVPDVWTVIFQYLTMHELISITSSMNRDLKELAMTTIEKRTEHEDLNVVIPKGRNLNEIIEFTDEQVLRNNPFKFISSLTISNGVLQPDQLRIILQNCERLEYLEMFVRYGVFSELPSYPTTMIPTVRTLRMQGELDDNDLEQMAITLPNLNTIDYLYYCSGYSAVGVMFLDAYVEFDINPSFDTFIYGVEAHYSEKNISVHFQ